MSRAYGSGWALGRPMGSKHIVSGRTLVRCYTTLQNETIWLTQQKIAGLFGVQRPAITKHLKNIFGTGKLQE